MPKPKLIKRILEYGLLAIAAIFTLSLLFVPLNYFSMYAGWLITIGVVLFIVTIVMDLFYFAKETPNRKWGKRKKEDTRRVWGIKRKTFIFLMELTGTLILLLLILGFKKGSIGSTDCPDIIQGNPDSDFRIKYFYSPFCPYCWKEEPILKDILDEHGEYFSLERYDIRYCDEEVGKYNVIGTPTFVFGNKTDIKEFKQHGFISKEQLERIILSERTQGGTKWTR